jgi:hypothetical protein
MAQFALCTLALLWQTSSMSTLTIELSDDLAARLATASEQAHVPPAQFVRAALEKALPAPAQDFPTEGPSAYDLLKDGFGCVSTGIGDLSTNPRHMEGYGRSRQ